ncbi:hypothetical protein BDV23DRAFT_166784 [Aspergillus alliaceus]|uniref:Uncharacterized protein n=1 Tax=Petromyces alliaceus TaxID=209559 RepID=A0A5N7BRG5_PETAA|nr:hypothetical protein BDV23DRAFT_166784 [Aspergillus alliaceus]
MCNLTPPLPPPALPSFPCNPFQSSELESFSHYPPIWLNAVATFQLSKLTAPPLQFLIPASEWGHFVETRVLQKKKEKKEKRGKVKKGKSFWVIFIFCFHLCFENVAIEGFWLVEPGARRIRNPWWHKKGKKRYKLKQNKTEHID